MATVYLARDVRHDRKVAIKVLTPGLLTSSGAERFLREITTTANLRHPHILPLYDSGQVPASGSDADAVVYYVMPFIDGGTLRDRLDRDKQLPIDEALAIAREVADALGYAHREAAARTIALSGPDYPFSQAVDGYVKAKAGDTAGARRVLREMGTAPRLPQRALVYAALGERDSMYVMFERAIDAKDPDAIWFLNAIPSLRPMRQDPRYQQLLERMGLPKEWRR